MRVVVAGATGMIGTQVVRMLRERGDDVVRLVRHAPAASDERSWRPDDGEFDPALLDGADAVINLAGASVGRIPWTASYKRTLVESRVGPTRTLAAAMAKTGTPPRVFLSGSAVGFYGDRPGEELTETSSAGSGFFPELVTEWEAAARTAPSGVRVVSLRTAVVVSPKGGGLAPVRTLTRFGLGARFGSGRQVWPWISLHDEAAAIVHLLGSELEGPVNLAGPTPASSDHITRAFATLMHRPYLLRVPAFAVRMLGEAGQRLLLDSMTVLPTRLEADGFTWRHRTAEEAIGAALGLRD